MKIFNKFFHWANYKIETYKLSYTKIKVEDFHFNEVKKIIIVSYRIGNKRLLNNLDINNFQHKYFDQCLSFDQHRLTKFATLQGVLRKTNKDGVVSEIIKIIEDEIKNEKLF